MAGLFCLGISCAASAQTAEPIRIDVSNGETEIYIGGADDKKNDGRGPVQSYYRGLKVQTGRTVGYFTASQKKEALAFARQHSGCLLYTSPSPRDRTRSRMPSSA